MPAHDDVALIESLLPLIEHRCAEQALTLPPLSFRQGESCGEWLARHAPPEQNLRSPWHPKRAVRVPVLTWEPGQDVNSWLHSYGASLAAGLVNPAFGVPFYLLFAGRPGPLTQGDRAYIAYDLQYDLDLFWGVGRLCFCTASGGHDYAAYTAYAEQVVAYERKAPPNNRHIIYFATDHDESTAASRDGLVRPLSEGDSTLGVVAPARKRGFTQESLIGPTATRANLQTVLRGAGPGGKPALLFAATHGAEFRPFTARDLPGRQGALICQDWTGEGEVRPEHWFAADELPADLDVEGLIVVCFACYGLGCPQFDSYTPAEGRKRQVAPRALVAALPQRLLARGALAVVGHIDIAWSYSFSSLEAGVTGQVQGFDELLQALMHGQRLDYAIANCPICGALAL